MRSLLLSAIRFYQRIVSPYKGFCCAAGAYYGSDSCSTAIRKVIEEQGPVRGRKRIVQQFQLCRKASRAIRAEKKKPRRRPASDSVACFADVCWSCAIWP